MNKEMKKKLFGYELELQKILPDKMEESKIVKNNVMELLKTLVQQRNHEQLYPIVVDFFTRLAMGDILSPLTGEADEWVNISEGVKSNLRYPYVMKIGEKYIDTRAILFENKEGYKYVTEASKVEIQFPYMPDIKILKDYEE